jgi:hypothetical protein
VFPHGDYDTFILSLERLSGTNALRSHMHSLRARWLKASVRRLPGPPLGRAAGKERVRLHFMQARSVAGCRRSKAACSTRRAAGTAPATVL